MQTRARFERPLLVAALFGMVACTHGQQPQVVYQVSYTDHTLAAGAVPAQPVVEFTPPASAPPAADAGTLTLDPDHRHQTMVGVGAAFSEIGSLAFLKLPPDQRQKLLTDLFDPKAGAGFQMCRLPIGSSDFATGPYSYDDQPGDFAMSAFGIGRDEKSMIPVVRAALKINPALTIFASPWSPPAWLKVNGKVDGGGKDSRLIDEPATYDAYSLYFQKYIQAYAADGIVISRLCPQNEMDYSPKYPGCVVPPPQMIKLVTRIAARFKEAGVATQIWAGTFRETHGTPWAKTCLQDPAFRDAITGLGVQYCSGNAVNDIRAAFPATRLMFTEALCNGGGNTPSEARGRLGQMMSAYSYGCDSFAYWNMMLDEHQKSGWDWKQNSLVTIDRDRQTVRYNPDYQPMYLMSRSVRPGDVLIDTHYHPGPKHLQAVGGFIESKAQYVIIAQNQDASPVTLNVTAGRSETPVAVTLPGHADCAIRLKLAE